ncbi:MAG: hypothetical protein H0U74_11410 [Bradymonadaceae bacterium]|nr:hypothetical protein [Lujinxingiaceae bacterium]
MNRYHLGTALLSAGILIASGCGSDSLTPLPTGDGDSAATGLSLKVEMKEAADVAAVRFSIETCAGELMFSGDKDFEELMLPGGMPAFELGPFDATSQHLFADHFMVLGAGCYNVAVQPLTSTGGTSEACTEARAQGVMVEDGRTTEIMLVSQCKAPPVGAVDVIGAINVAPMIEALEFEKFTRQCRENVICAIASDGNADGLEFDWSLLSGPALAHAPVVVNRAQLTGRRTVECVSLVPAAAGEHTLEVRVFDHDANGRMENQNGVESRASLMFPLHVANDPAIDDCAQFVPQAQIFVANLTPLNAQLNFAPANGIAKFIIEGDRFTAITNSQGLAPNMIHPQHIHGFMSAEQAVCPPVTTDPNNDGVLDVIEGLPFYGPILLNLDQNLENLDEPGPFPMSFGEKGRLHYKATASVSALLEAFGTNTLMLDTNTVVQHGIPLTTPLPSTVQTLPGLPPQLTLPLNCGKIMRVDRFGPN